MQRNVDRTHQSSYYVAFTEVIKILNIGILKYVKLITINLECCNINNIQSIKNNPLHCKFMVINFMYFKTLMFNILITSVKATYN
jgi:hypothetical protein